MKLALVSTPRSGNTWLRYLLSAVFDLQQYAVHDPAALEWRALPQRCIVQMHWNRTADIQAVFEEAGFQVITIKRHPLDVLLSILHFCANEPQTRSWLLGEGGNEDSLHGKTPCDPEFLHYATGSRAKALLSVSAQWWSRPDVIGISYEDLVRDTVGTFDTSYRQLGEYRRSLQDVVSELTLDRLRPTSQNSHFWNGQPGLWRQMIPESIALAIASVHPQVLIELGYGVDNPSSPTQAQAVQRWLDLA